MLVEDLLVELRVGVDPLAPTHTQKLGSKLTHAEVPIVWFQVNSWVCGMPLLLAMDSQVSELLLC